MSIITKQLIFNWTKVNHDSFGNPRYAIHFSDCMPSQIVLVKSIG